MAETKSKNQPAKSEAAGVHLTAEPIQITGEAKVLHRPKAVRLDGYPRLVYAPDFGPGIRTEDNQTEVAEICQAVAENPDYQAVAEKFGTTAEHVAEAVDYAAKAGFVTPK